MVWMLSKIGLALRNVNSYSCNDLNSSTAVDFWTLPLSGWSHCGGYGHCVGSAFILSREWSKWMQYILSSNFLWTLPFVFFFELRFNCCLATSPDSAVPTAVVSTAVVLGVSWRQLAYTCQCVKPPMLASICYQLQLKVLCAGSCGWTLFFWAAAITSSSCHSAWRMNSRRCLHVMNPGHRLKFSFHFKKSWIKLIPKGGCTWALAALYLPSILGTTLLYPNVLCCG